MLNKESIREQIDLELTNEMRSTAIIDAPPTELTKLLLYLDLTDTKEATRFVEKIAKLVDGKNLWHTSLVEVLAVFNWDDNLHNLYPVLIKYLYTKNLHKFSCMFGNENRLQYLALIHLKIHLAQSDLGDITMMQLYNFLALAYCVEIESFRSFLRQLATRISIDSFVDHTSIHVNIESNDLDAKTTSATAIAASDRFLNQKGNRLKIAICISGQLRGYRHFHSTLSRLNIEDHHYKVFVSTWEVVGGRFPHLDQAERIFPEKFAANFREIMVILGEQEFRYRYPNLVRLIENPTRVTFDQLASFYGSQFIDLQDDHVEPFDRLPSIAKMHYKLGRCLELVLKQTSDFDLIVRMRPDLRFEDPISVDWVGCIVNL